MNKIDLSSILSHTDSEYGEVAKALFPQNQYPVLALNRVKSGDALLNTDQVQILSSITGMSIPEIFGGKGWKKSLHKSCLKFERDGYTVLLDQVEWTTRIYHKDVRVHEEVLHSPLIPLREYLEQIDQMVAKIEFNQNPQTNG